MSEKVAPKEVGTIGQTYENRKTKKLGVVESRDEKYKTLLMRDKEGNSFSINYSTFRSDWRKYNGDKAIQTSTQVEERKEKMKKAEAKVEKKPKQEKISKKEMFEIVSSLKEIIDAQIEKSKLDLVTKVNTKNGIAIKNGRISVAEFWYNAYTKKYDIYSKYELTLTGAEYKLYDNWKLCHKYTVDKVEKAVKEFISSIKDEVKKEDK